MTTSPSEDYLVGLLALGLVLLIAVRIVRGIREGTLPLYRTYIRRDEDRTRFNFLLALHALSLVLVAMVSADLLLGLGLREAL